MNFESHQYINTFLKWAKEKFRQVKICPRVHTFKSIKLIQKLLFICRRRLFYLTNINQIKPTISYQSRSIYRYNKNSNS